MIQLLSIIARALAHRSPQVDEPYEEAERWHADPLAHPALRVMSQTQLADLPIGHPASRPAQLAPTRPAPRRAPTSLSIMSAG